MTEETGGFYIEYFQLGQQVKVSAIDSVSGIEVSIVAPTNVTQAEMTRVAVEKLKRRLEKQSGELTRDDKKSDDHKDTRGGVIV